MNLQKAIENLIRLRDMGYIELGKDFKDALSLGIEAIKRLEKLRLLYFDPARKPLPGETKE